MADNKYTYHFMKEVHQKQERSFVMPTFVPDFKAVPITNKFYSKFETKDLQEDIRTKKNLELVEFALKSTPRDRYPHPILESHLITWKPGFKKKYDKTDNEMFNHPLLKGDLSSYGEKLAMEKGITERPRWNGLIFKLQ